MALYLDERHEREERRAAVHLALFSIGPGCAANMLNELMERAGLTYRCELMDSFDHVRKMVVGEAVRKGLL
jgi:hypothetical protein